MTSCHDQTANSAGTLAYRSKTGRRTIALAGNPNSGKTTIFNALTGLRQKVANYPGVTVEKKVGRCKLPDGIWCDIIDLPGTYSLISRSPDEQVAMEVLRAIRTDVNAPDAVIVVVDASNLQRNLYLVSQLIELGRPLVIALNMTDVALSRGLIVSAEAMEKELGVPVIPLIGHKRHNIQLLKESINKARVAPLPHWPMPEAMCAEVRSISQSLAQLNLDPEFPAKETDGDGPSPGRACACTEENRTGDGPAPQSDAHPGFDRFGALAERLLISDSASDIRDLRDHPSVAALLADATSRLHQLGIDPMQADVEAHYHWIESVATRVVTSTDGPPGAGGVLSYARPRTLTERVDAILIHKVWGLLTFAAIMAILFVALFWAAKPIMDGIQAGIDFLGANITSHMVEGPLHDLVKDGVFAGVGTVVVFVPQIAMLFLFLAILEDTGYLARAAFLMDRLLSKVGLHGKSFIPLLSSFACAIPGIMACRTIENRRERLATILVAPFMSCSARLPVYTLLIGAFFATLGPLKQAGIMLALYGLGIVAAAGTAWVFKRSLNKGPATSFILELPSYKIPQVSQILRQMWSNTAAFLTKAGTTIFCLSVVLWAMAYYPRLPEATAQQVHDRVLSDAKHEIATRLPLGPYSSDSPVEEQAKQRAQWIQNHLSPQDTAEAEKVAGHAVEGASLEHSVSGRLGHLMEPVFRPLGFDWKIDIGLISAFAAREVFVSSMGIVYSVGQVEEGETTDLTKAMQADTYNYGPRKGQMVWTPVVAVSLLVWFVLAMQCMSTVAIVRRETGGWRWPIFMIVYMNVLAYVVSLIVYQVGVRLFA
jgi:ferrous iron transport protein B